MNFINKMRALNGVSPDTNIIRARLLQALLLASALLFVTTLLYLVPALRNGAGLHVVSGVWATLATDLAHGVFYRPIISESGYGGTRYFPLMFVLHAVLIRGGISPVAAGHGLSVCCTVALMGGVYYLLRRMGVRIALAIACAILVLCSTAVQLALITIRGDILPAALNIWGLAFAAGSFQDNRRKSHMWLAALCFTLAFTAKMTTVFGLIAAFADLYLAGRRKAALEFGLIILIGIAFSLGVIHVASQGRGLESMLLCASGGVIWRSVLHSPVEWFMLAKRMDPCGLLFLLLAVLGLLLNARSHRHEVPALALFATAIITIFLFSSPGISVNHLIDLDVIALVVLTVQLERSRVHFAFVTICLTGAAMLSSSRMFSLFGTQVRTRVSQRAQFAQALSVADASRGPLLAKNPWIPILGGERPYMLDPWMFRIIGEKRPALTRDLQAKLDQRFFRAVVLEASPQTAQGKMQSDKFLFGPGFTAKLLENYELAGPERDETTYRLRRYFIYFPKQKQSRRQGSSTAIAQEEVAG